MSEESRIFAAIDGDNLFFQQRHAGFRIDPAKLKECIAQYGRIVNSVYYISQHEESSDARERFLRALVHMGYSLVTQQVKSYYTSNDSVRMKSNLDVKIATDIILAMDKFDTLFLVTGDVDFMPVLQAVLAHGKDFKILCADGMISRELRDLAGQNFISLDQWKPFIEKQQNGIELYEVS